MMETAVGPVPEGPATDELGARVARERDAHTDRDVLAESYRLKARFAHILTYPSRQRLFGRLDEAVAGADGLAVLDYGCGRGEQSLDLLAHGAVVSGIDISPVYVADAAEAARTAGYAACRFDFRVMDAHALDFPGGTFDLVIGRGILHHLDPDVALAEIHRVLKPGGRVLLQEPLADHPLLKLFRRLTPHARTEDEAPFTSRDLRRLADSDRWTTDLAFCGIVSAPAAMLTSVILPRRPGNALLRLADRAEGWVHRRGWLPAWNQYVLFDMRKR